MFILFALIMYLVLATVASAALRPRLLPALAPERHYHLMDSASNGQQPVSLR